MFLFVSIKLILAKYQSDWVNINWAHDPAFEIFHITHLPQLSHVVSNMSSAVDIASCG